MNRNHLVVGLLAILSLASQLFAQNAKVDQKWIAPRGAHESRVITCTNPIPAAGWSVSMDDWICPKTGPIYRVQWWGIVSTPAQLTRRYHIGIWNTLATACRPGTKIYGTCVVPSSVFVGTDCRQRRVYRFTASLTPAFTQVANTRYWLQVSEDDSNSVVVGQEDFRWSSHIPIKNCPAVRINGGGVVTQPIRDDCLQPIDTDLAFRLFGNTIIVGRIPPPHLVSPSVFLLKIKSPNGDVIDTMPIEPSEDGSFEAETDLPPGQYQCELAGMGLAGLVSFFDVFTDMVNTVPVPPACLNADFDMDGDTGTDDDIETFFQVLGGLCD